MSGHNKWSTIKRKKGANDAARAKVFTKIGRELAVAVKNGGPDPNNNAKLRDVIAKAKQNNVPNDNIDRMLKKAAGDADTTNYEEIIYDTVRQALPLLLKLLPTTETELHPRYATTSIKQVAIWAHRALLHLCLARKA